MYSVETGCPAVRHDVPKHTCGLGWAPRGERFLSDCYDYNTALTWGLSEAAYNLWEEPDYTRRMQYDRFSRE